MATVAFNPKSEKPAYSKVHLQGDRPWEQRLLKYELKRNVKKEFNVSIPNKDLSTKEKRKAVEKKLKEVAKTEIDQNYLPPVKVAGAGPYTMPFTAQTADYLTSITSPTEAVITYTQATPEISINNIRVEVVDQIRNNLMGFIGLPYTSSTVDALSTSISNTLTATTTGVTDYRIIADTDKVTLTIPNEGFYEFSLEDSIPFTANKGDYARKLIQSQIKSNLLIKMGGSRKYIPTKINPAELKARETLRDMITEADWRRYVTNGFIMVKGTSGFWYQVFNMRSARIRVYKDGNHTHNLCIHTDQECPPSDHVINMKVLVELDEASIWKGSNIGSPYKDHYTQTLQPPTHNLVEQFRRLKAG